MSRARPIPPTAKVAPAAGAARAGGAVPAAGAARGGDARARPDAAVSPVRAIRPAAVAVAPALPRATPPPPTALVAAKVRTAGTRPSPRGAIGELGQPAGPGGAHPDRRVTPRQNPCPGTSKCAPSMRTDPRPSRF